MLFVLLGRGELLTVRLGRTARVGLRLRHSMLPTRSIRAARSDPFLLFRKNVQRSLRLSSGSLLCMRSGKGCVQMGCRGTNGGIRYLLHTAVGRTRRMATIYPLILGYRQTFLIGIHGIIGIGKGSRKCHLLLRNYPRRVPMSQNCSGRIGRLVRNVSNSWLLVAGKYDSSRIEYYLSRVQTIHPKCFFTLYRSFVFTSRGIDGRVAVGKFCMPTTLDLVLLSLPVTTRDMTASAVLLTAFGSDVSLSRMMVGTRGAPETGDH